MSCLEHLSCKFFLIYNAVSKSEEATNLQERMLNICVTEPGFKFIGNTAPVIMYKQLIKRKKWIRYGYAVVFVSDRWESR